MKIKYLIISLLIFITLTLSIKQYLFPAGNKKDPLNNSFILNHLEMDSDTIPSLESQELAEGGIIFDNSFIADKSKADKNKVEKSKVSPNINDILKKIPDYDERVHLTEYKIKKNENLWTIAKRNNISIDILSEINNIKDPKRVRVNDTILIPSKKGIYYKIKSGDTLTKIAQKYNTKVELIAEHNKINNAKIIAGKNIFLPDVELHIEAESKKEIESKKGIEIAKLKKNESSIKENKENKANKANKENKENKENIAEKSKEKTGSKLVLSWPLRGPITSGFGTRKDPFSKGKKFHCGLDIGAEEGTSVKAAGDGKVIFSGWKDVYGNMIVIEHENNYLTIYAHNSINFVGENEIVKRGDVIAASGKTGAVTGAHLHFEIRKGVVPLNPLRILKK